MLAEKTLAKKMQIDAKKNRVIYNVFREASLLQYYPAKFEESEEKTKNDRIRGRLGSFLKNRDKQENGEIRLFGNSYEWDCKNYYTILKVDWGWNEDGCRLNTPMFRLYMHVTEPETYFQRVSKYLVSHDFDEMYRLVKNEMCDDLYNSTIRKFLEAFNPEPYARLIHSLNGRQIDFLIGYLRAGWSGKDHVERLAGNLGADEVKKLCDYLKIKDVFWQNYYHTHSDSISELFDCGCKAGTRIAKQISKHLNGLI